MLTLTLLASCAWLVPRPAGVGRVLDWNALPGWQTDRHAEAWPALLHSCNRLAAREPRWQKLCRAAQAAPAPDDATARRFFETWFEPYEVTGERGAREGLVTGYYEPLLHGSFTRSARYRYPLYKQPADLLAVELGELYPELKNKTVRGRLQGNRILPYYSRADIDSGRRPLAGQELLWVDDPVALFFLHVQGSGRVRLADGRSLGVGYADQNGHPYQSIGRRLVDMGELKLEQVTLQSIRAWLQQHPEQAAELFAANPSFVFFRLRETGAPGPLGKLNVPLTPQRSLAVDPAYVPLGVPVWLDTTLPDADSERYRRLVFAQDGGGAIRGPLRADLFFGHGDEAERLAGGMKQPGRLFVLLPAREY